MYAQNTDAVYSRFFFICLSGAESAAVALFLSELQHRPWLFVFTLPTHIHTRRGGSVSVHVYVQLTVSLVGGERRWMDGRATRAGAMAVEKQTPNNLIDTSVKGVTNMNSCSLSQEIRFHFFAPQHVVQ